MWLAEGHCLRGHALDACQLHDRPQRAQFEASSLHTLVQMVAVGIGVTRLPRLAIDAQITRATNIKLIPLSRPASRQIGLVWRQSCFRSRDIEVLGEVLASLAKEPRQGALAGRTAPSARQVRVDLRSILAHPCDWAGRKVPARKRAPCAAEGRVSSACGGRCLGPALSARASVLLWPLHARMPALTSPSLAIHHHQQEQAGEQQAVHLRARSPCGHARCGSGRSRGSRKAGARLHRPCRQARLGKACAAISLRFPSIVRLGLAMATATLDERFAGHHDGF